MRRLLDRLFPGQLAIDSYRPAWLTSSKTGMSLELDRYYPELSVAFEYQEDQHYKYLQEMHKDWRDFNYQVEKDKLKRRLCKKQGVFIIYVHQSDLSEYGLATLVDGMVRAKSQGRWFHNKKKIQHLLTKPRRKRRRKRKNRFVGSTGLRVLGSWDTYRPSAIKSLVG